MSTLSHSKHFYQTLEMEERDQNELCSNLPTKMSFLVVLFCFVVFPLCIIYAVSTAQYIQPAREERSSHWNCDKITFKF